MKTIHRKIIKDKLPDLLTKIEKVLQENGLEEFDVKQVVFEHKSFKPDCSPNGVARREWNGVRFQWVCRPK